MATIDIADKTTLDATKTVVDNIYAKVDTEVASTVSNTATNNTASKTGILSQKSSYAISLLENSTYGLSAIKTAISNSGGGAVKSIQRGVVSSFTNSTSTLQNATVTINTVNAAKCVVILNGSASGNSPEGSGGSNYDNSYSTLKKTYLITMTNTSITIAPEGYVHTYYSEKNGSTYSAVSFPVSWQVIEFY